MYTIKEYCKVLGGEPSAVLDILSELEDYIYTNTKPEPDNYVDSEDKTTPRSESELILVKRQELKNNPVIKELLKVADQKLIKWSNYWIEDLETLEAQTKTAIDTTTSNQQETELLITDTLESVLTTEENINDEIEELILGVL